MDRARRASVSCPDMGKILPWDAFDNWVHAICVVTFDLELGQAMELVLPSAGRLSDQERTSVCYLAFPDSNSGCMGDTQFFFRMMRTDEATRLSEVQTRYNSLCPPSLQIDGAFLYGFAYFRQVKDRSLRRGYFQKSVVLLTRYPFVNLFGKVMELLAPEFFDGDGSTEALEAACADIDRWPEPVPGRTLALPVRGHTFQVRLPSQLDKLLPCPPLPASPARQPQSSSVVASVAEPELFSALQPLLAHAQLLWELVITAEPLVVMATTPAVCSHVVQALVSLVWPLRYCGDHRPFFTIHDTDFKELTQLAGSQAPPPVILGVTNPFFAKTLQQWPHILRIGEPAPTARAGSKQPKNKIKKGGNLKTLDVKPGLYTQYKPFLQKDKSIEKKLLRGQQTERPREVQSALLRRYLLELTQSFILPLERYIATLMPLQRSISPYKAAPVMRPFNPDDFCQRLVDSGPQLTTGIKGDWVGLYRRFFRSTNFSHWFNERHADISRKLQALHLEALSDADVLSWVKGRQEVEVVDLVLRLRQKLAEADSDQLPVHANTLAKLRLHLMDVMRSLPEDVRAVLKQPS